MGKFKFTKQAVTAPDLSVGTHYDTEVKGLVVNVTPTSRRFGVYGWYNGTATRRSIGNVADWSITAVREEALKVIAELKHRASGPGPALRTLGDLADAYTRELEKQGNRDTTYVTASMRLNWKDFTTRPIGSITKEELREVHYMIGEGRGKAAANRAVVVMRILFNFAIQEEIVTRNPASRVALYPTESRDVFLNEQEIRTLREALAEIGGDIQDYFLLILNTGLRRANAAGLRWDWIDGDLLTVPAANSKNKSEMPIPLTAEAQEILKRRANGTPFVFPGRWEGRPVREVWHWLLAVRAAMREKGVEKEFCIHDIRRSAASLLASRGAGMPVVAKFLGHKSLHTVSTYMRADVGDVRAALDRAAAG